MWYRILGIAGAIVAMLGGLVAVLVRRAPATPPRPPRRIREHEESAEAREVDALSGEVADVHAEAERVKAAKDALARARAASRLRG